MLFSLRMLKCLKGIGRVARLCHPQPCQCSVQYQCKFPLDDNFCLSTTKVMRRIKYALASADAHSSFHAPAFSLTNALADVQVTCTRALVMHFFHHVMGMCVRDAMVCRKQTQHVMGGYGCTYLLHRITLVVLKLKLSSDGNLHHQCCTGP